MVDKWRGKVAVISGASSGIGAKIFSDFARHGIKVVGLARRLERIEALIESLDTVKENLFALHCDIADPQSVAKAFKIIEEKYGFINILVNNAGVCKNLNILDPGESSFLKLNETIDTNFRGLVQCTREAYNLMDKSDEFGLIINISSIAAHSVPFMTFSSNVYSATKHAVKALTEIVRQELVISGRNRIRIAVSTNI